LQVLKAKANWEGEEKKGSWLHDDLVHHLNKMNYFQTFQSHPEWLNNVM